jgi:hypothetical protein
MIPSIWAGLMAMHADRPQRFVVRSVSHSPTWLINDSILPTEEGKRRGRPQPLERWGPPGRELSNLTDLPCDVLARVAPRLSALRARRDFQTC